MAAKKHGLGRWKNCQATERIRWHRSPEVGASRCKQSTTEQAESAAGCSLWIHFCYRDVQVPDKLPSLGVFV